MSHGIRLKPLSRVSAKGPDRVVRARGAGDIISLWETVSAQDLKISPTQAMERMNEALGSNHQLSRLGAWRNQRRVMPGDVYHFMLLDVLQHALKSAGIHIDSGRLKKVRNAVSMTNTSGRFRAPVFRELLLRVLEYSLKAEGVAPSNEQAGRLQVLLGEPVSAVSTPDSATHRTRRLSAGREKKKTAKKKSR